VRRSTELSRRAVMVGHVTRGVMSTRLHHDAVSMTVLLVVLIAGDVTSTWSRRDDAQHSLLAIENSDDALAQRDQPMVSHIVNDINRAAATTFRLHRYSSD